MKLPSLPLLILDTETTGFVPKVHHVIEFAAQRYENGKKVAEYEQLISCDGSVPPHIEVLTQIKTGDLTGKPRFAEIIPKLNELITPDTLIVGQNILFDIGMLRGEGWDLTDMAWIDTSMLASIALPECRSFSLGYLSTVLTLNHTPKHRALGDVRATVELLARCSERLEQLPQADIEEMKRLAQRGPPGYQRFFASLTSDSKAKKRPQWLASTKTVRKHDGEIQKIELKTPSVGTVQIIEESIDKEFTQSLIHSLENGTGRTWLAVKNLEALLRRTTVSGSTSVFFPPELLLHRASADALLAQPTFRAEELTLAIKLTLFEPTRRADFAIHGEEYSVWNGKLACTVESPEYLQQCEALAPLVLIDHGELLRLIALPDSIIPAGSSIVIDDASMLEDTATHAYGWTCVIRFLRAAAQGNERLTRFTDLLELWMEKTRGGTDLRYIVASDLETDDARGLRAQLKDIRDEQSNKQIDDMLAKLAAILDGANLAGRFAWIETFIDGSKSIKSVPENVALLLQESLYSQHAVTLLMPVLRAAPAHAIINQSVPQETSRLPEKQGAAPVAISFPRDWQLAQALLDSTGKTVLLMSSKRAIEDVFIRYAKLCEDRGITLLCQGMSGGQSRMQAELDQAQSPAVLISTPWSYETYELQPRSIDRLIVQSLPFDHPSHAVISRRSQLFTDPFNDYCLPRLKHRLFRLMKTFSRHVKPSGQVLMLDDRLRTKAYGKGVQAYLEQLSAPAEKKADGQLSLL